jgi:hypothetical protein
VRSRTVTAIVVAALSLASRAVADPSAGSGSGSGSADPSYFHIESAWHLKTAGGSERDLPPAHVYLDPDWSKLDAEFRRLQSEGTRLGAENKSLKKSLESWQPGWVIVLTAVVAGGVIGWLGHEYVAPHL